MCGIVGNVLARGDRAPDPAVLKRMNDRLVHRGPDDEGFFLEGPAALAMRRLKIIDLETGHQPMSGEHGRVWAVFNGEIYNYRELTAELAGRGHTFRTRSDTEVIVHGYEERGLASLGDLEGMFAIALWDAPARTLVLARDRIGIKPLYYAALPDQLVFASELKALVEHPAIDRALDLTALVALPRPRIRSGAGVDLPLDPQASSRPLAHVHGWARQGRAVLDARRPPRP